MRPADVTKRQGDPVRRQDNERPEREVFVAGEIPEEIIAAIEQSKYLMQRA